MTAYLKFKGYVFNTLYIFDRSKEWTCSCGTWHCLLVPENSSKQHSTLNPLTNLYKTKLSCSTIVLACSTKLWTWHSSMCFTVVEYLQPNESLFGCCKLTFFKMLFLHANPTVKKLCELLLSPIHQAIGFFCSYEVIGLYPWRKSCQYLLHGRLGGLRSCLGEEINPVAVFGIHNFIDVKPVP